MEICSRAGMMNLRSLCHLVLRAWRKIFALSGHEHINPSPMEETPGNDGSLELPEDILMDIFALLEIPDLVRSGCVCSSWHKAYTNLRSYGLYTRQQTPCLLYTSESAGDNVAYLYSLADQRVYKLTLPEPPIRSRYLIGSSNGCLVTADENAELHIVHPITSEQIALPSVTTIEQVKPISDDAGAIKEYEFSQYYGEEEIYSDPDILAVHELREKLYVKAFVFFDASKGSYVVALIHNPIHQLSFACVGDSKWTWLPPSAQYEDCIYIDGILYAVTSCSGIDAFDLGGPTILRKVIMDDIKHYIRESIYIIQAPSGDLLQVWREQTVSHGDAPDGEPSEIKFETREIMLYKVDMAAKELVKISSLHGHALFLGYNESLCLRAEDSPQLQANHAYLTDHEKDIAFLKGYCRDICVFNLESNVPKEIVAPQSWCCWPAPIWITLNLTKLGSALKK